MARVNEELTMLDIRGPIGVEIEISLQGTVLWVNIDGVCRLRVQDIKEGTLIIGQNLQDLITEER
jgi:hypothetical protein